MLVGRARILDGALQGAKELKQLDFDRPVASIFDPFVNTGVDFWDMCSCSCLAACRSLTAYSAPNQGRRCDAARGWLHLLMAIHATANLLPIARRTRNLHYKLS